MKINLLVFFLFTSFLLNAQIKKGSLFIGGDVSVYKSDANTTNPDQYTSKSNGFSFSPSLGWVLKDNLVIGGSLLVSFNKSEQQNLTFHNKGNRIGGGIWMRKYLPVGKSFFLFGNAALNAQSVYSKYTSEPPFYFHTEKGYAINASIFPGISYQIKKSLFIEVALNNLITLGFERKNIEDQKQGGNIYKGTSTSYNLHSSLGNGVPLQIGMRWIIANN